MKTHSGLTPQVAFWGLCLVALAWIVATGWFEFHLGGPETSLQWGKRMLGWCVEIWFIRTLVVGTRRCMASPQR